jgi:hypothetical protein
MIVIIFSLEVNVEAVSEVEQLMRGVEKDAQQSRRVVYQ